MDLNKVLDDLRSEKRWLENVIEALEVVSRSPAERLVHTLDKSLTGRSNGGLRINSRKRMEVARLVDLIQHGRGRRAA